MSAPSPFAKYGMRTVALTYLLLLLALPLAMIFVKTFEEGISEAWSGITSEDGLHAFYLTLVCVGIAVPLNTTDPRYAAYADREIHMFDGRIVDEETLHRLREEEDRRIAEQARRGRGGATETTAPSS